MEPVQCQECDFSTCRESSLRKHMREVHGVGAWRCPIPGCTYQTTKRSDQLKRHMASCHSIDVQWYPCPEPGCTYRAKSRSHLRAHQDRMHDPL